MSEVSSIFGQLFGNFGDHLPQPWAGLSDRARADKFLFNVLSVIRNKSAQNLLI